MESMTNRQEQGRGAILDLAKDIINGQRTDRYGAPENSFALIADLWNDYLKMKFGNNSRINSHDVAMLMVLLKIARIAHGAGGKDSYVDGIGYLALANEMNEYEAMRSWAEEKQKKNA